MFKTSLAFFIYFLCYSKCVFIPLCEFSVSSVVSPWDHLVCSTLNAGSEHCCLPTALAADGCYVTEHWTTPPSQRASPDPEPATPQCRLIHKPTAALCRAHSLLTKHICYVFLCTWKKKNKHQILASLLYRWAITSCLFSLQTSEHQMTSAANPVRHKACGNACPDDKAMWAPGYIFPANFLFVYQQLHGREGLHKKRADRHIWRCILL